MRKEHFENQWFLIPTIGIKKIEAKEIGFVERRLTLAWLNFGMSFPIKFSAYTPVLFQILLLAVMLLTEIWLLLIPLILISLCIIGYQTEKYWRYKS